MPAPLRDRLNKKVQQTGAYGSTSDYVRDLIRRDLASAEDEGRRDYLEAKAGKGLSPVFETADAFLDDLHRSARSRKPLTRTRRKK